MPSYFEIIDAMNKAKFHGGRGLGSVPYSQDPSSASYAIFNAPGRIFSDRCRTKTNPFGWLIGTGGSDYPTPLDITITAQQWQDLHLDASLSNAESLQFLYGCPDPNQYQVLVSQDPFINPNQPPGTPYGQNVGGTTVTNLPAGTVPVNPFPNAGGTPATSSTTTNTTNTSTTTTPTTTDSSFLGLSPLELALIAGGLLFVVMKMRR